MIAKERTEIAGLETAGNEKAGLLLREFPELIERGGVDLQVDPYCEYPVFEARYIATFPSSSQYIYILQLLLRLADAPVLVHDAVCFTNFEVCAS